MKNWKITGIIATIVIIASIPAYVVKKHHFRQTTESAPIATFVAVKNARSAITGNMTDGEDPTTIWRWTRPMKTPSWAILTTSSLRI